MNSVGGDPDSFMIYSCSACDWHGCSLWTPQQQHMEERTAARCTTPGVSRLHRGFLATVHGGGLLPITHHAGKQQKQTYECTLFLPSPDYLQWLKAERVLLLTIDAVLHFKCIPNHTRNLGDAMLQGELSEHPLQQQQRFDVSASWCLSAILTSNSFVFPAEMIELSISQMETKPHFHF